MELVAEFSQFEQGSSNRRVKSRSKACLHCRRRKMRCDGVKPACFQCVRAERANECEYDDGITKTNTQLLYERLAMLEKRYRDLQASRRAQNRKVPPSDRGLSGSAFSAETSKANLARSNSAPDRVHTQSRVTGDGPYEQSISGLVVNQHSAHNLKFGDHSAPSSTRLTSSVHTPSTRRFDITSTSFSSHSSTHSGRSTPSTSEFSHPELSFHPKYAFTYGYQQVTHDPVINIQYDDPSQQEIGVPVSGMHNQLSPELVLDIEDDGEISPAMLEHLIDHFVAHSLQGGSPLLSSRIIDILSFTISDITSSLSCAMNCILLWGAQFSPVQSIRARKNQFLHDTLATLPPLLSSPLAVSPDWKSIERAAIYDPSRDDRYNVIMAINISTILATYFFSEGRNIEGAYHANTACRLALCAGLHHTPDPRLLRDLPSNSAGVLFDSRKAALDMSSRSTSSDLLPFPANVNTALERHHVFWNLFVLDRAWSAAGRLPASSSRLGVVAGGASDPAEILKEKDPRTAISTPWPQDWGLLILEEAEDDTTPPCLRSTHTIEDFLNGVEANPTSSILQLRAKSTALFEAASRISSLYDPYDPKPTYDASFATIQRSISMFIKTLPQLSKRGFSQPSFSKSSPYTIHTLVHAAIIRLYSRFADKAYKEGYCDNPSTLFSYSKDSPEASAQTISNVLLGYERVFSITEPSKADHSTGRSVGMACAAVDQCLFSARETARIASCIAPNDFSFLEPIIAPCWGYASEVLLRELRRVWPIPQASAKASLLSDVHTLEASLNRLGAVFPIGNIEARKVTEALNSITSGNALNVP